MNLYSIYDKAAAKFSQPWTADNDNLAKRAFERLAGDKTTDVGHYPQDFTLWCIGTFDLSSGEVYPMMTNITPLLSS